MPSSSTFTVIVTIDVTAPDSGINIDTGGLSPRVAYMALEAAAERLREVTEETSDIVLD